jgi:hypothetical protein
MHHHFAPRLSEIGSICGGRANIPFVDRTVSVCDIQCEITAIVTICGRINVLEVGCAGRRGAPECTDCTTAFAEDK